MKQLFIHIGTHKTGTSSLQKLCYKNANKLSSEGVNVLIHNNIPHKKNFNDGSLSRDELAHTLKNWLGQKLKSSLKKQFFCWEGFSGDLFSLYENRVKNLEILKEAIPNNIKLSFIVVFRRQDDFVQSAYSQAKHQGNFEDSTKNLLSTEYKIGIDWLRYVNDLKKVFPEAELNVLPYDKSLFKEKPLHVLIGEITGAEFLINYSEKLSSNVGMSNEGVRLFESINSQMKLDNNTQTILRRIIQENSNKGIYNEYNYLTFDQKNQLLSNYKNSNRKLAQVYWKDDFDIDDFTEPVKTIAESLNEGEVEQKVIIELLRIVSEQELKNRKSIALKIANRLNGLLGV